jgi:tryptophan-rich sensory protein
MGTTILDFWSSFDFSLCSYFISFVFVFYKDFQKQIPWIVVLPFVLNLIFNFSFTYLQFGLRSNFLAMIDVLLVLGTLVWAIVAIFPYIKWVSFINIPYLLWVSFASILQVTITFLNLKK